MTFKSIEVYYDIASIPGVFGRVTGPGLPAPDIAEVALEFRDAAIELIEDALLDAGAGEWQGAEIGMGEINFGFAVDDFDLAEAIVLTTVAGTPFAHYREIVRREFDPVVYA